MNKLKSIREKKVMSREELAAGAKCSFASIEKYETEKVEPKVYVALRIAKVLKTRVEAIWGG